MYACALQRLVQSSVMRFWLFSDQPDTLHVKVRLRCRRSLQQPVVLTLCLPIPIHPEKLALHSWIFPNGY